MIDWLNEFLQKLYDMSNIITISSILQIRKEHRQIEEVAQGNKLVIFLP